MENLLAKKEIATKKDIKNALEQIKKDLDVAKINPLDGAIYIKLLEEFIKAYKKDADIAQWTLEEAELYQKSFKYKGYELATKQAGVKYTYKDSTLDTINKQIEKLTEQKRERENLLTTLPEDVETFDKNTGELLHKAGKSSKTILTVKIK